MARIGKGKLGAAVVAAGMMLLGISNPAYAVPRSPSAEIPSPTGGLSSTEKLFGEIRVGEASGHAAAGLAAAADDSYSCQVKSPTIKSPLQYDTGSPPMLANIKWTGGGIATCTIPMASISYNIFAGTTQGTTSNSLAAGSCKGCSTVTALNKGYTCVQGTTIAEDCSGAWEAGYRVDITPPPGKTFTSTSGTCSPFGAGAVCYVLVPHGVAPLFAAPSSPCKAATAVATGSDRLAAAAAGEDCYNLPPSGNVMLSLKAINEIRDYHFPGGSRADNTKGLFLEKITSRDLAMILDAGLKDAGPWALNSTGYYQKTFAYTGVGNRSIKFGNGLPSTKVVVVVEQFGDEDYEVADVITMYPADA